jgi:type II secretory pathway component GspD/PulD (secretin)
MGAQWARGLALGVVLAGVLLASRQAVSQQAQPVGQPRKSARTLFTEANALHKAGDYEAAAKLYIEVQAQQSNLNPTDRKDLSNWIQKNNTALKGRQDGSFLLAKAEEDLQQVPPRIREAQEKYKIAKAIPYTDPKLLEIVYQDIQQKSGYAKPGPSVHQPGLGNGKALLAEGRNAYKRGMAQLSMPHPDLDIFYKELGKAYELASQAKIAGVKTIFPWQDSPDKLMADAKRELEKPRTINSSDAPPKKANILDKIFHRDPQNQPDKNGKDAKGNANDGPILMPVPDGKDKTSKGAESSTPMRSIKNFFSGGSSKEKSQPDPNVKQVSNDKPEPEHKNPGLIQGIFGNKEKNPPVAGANDSKAPAKDATKTVSNSPIQTTGDTSTPSSVPVRSPPDAKANNAQARQLIQNGYQALQAKDYQTARRCALQARDLRPDLEWYEQNPDRLLADIQKREPGSSNISVAAALNSPKSSDPSPAKEAKTQAEKEEQAKAKAKDLVGQGREQFKLNHLDEADKLCAQAAGIPGVKWLLFEDSPEKLHIDIQKARTHRDREEAARLVTEARALYKSGNYEEAKTKAWQAEKLHGPYSIWDLGDRPQKILADIEHSESKQKQNSTAQTDNQPESKVTPKDNSNQVAKNSGPNNSWFLIPPIGHKAESAKPPVESEAKTKARVLVAEARSLLQQGQLIPAREKAVAALNLRVVFNAGEDSPAAVMQDLGQVCVVHLNGYLKRAGDWVTGNPNDPLRMQKADADLASARALAVAFQLDARAVDEKQAWIQQVTATAPAVQPPPQNNMTAANRIGLEKLDMARLELKAGNTAVARRLAEDAFNIEFGVQQEAANVLRLIDAEEHNQFVLAAIKTMQSGMDAFRRHDFVQARSILASVDARLLDSERQRLLREVLSHPDMQPVQNTGARTKTLASGLQQISAQEMQTASAPGKAHVNDMDGPGGDAFDNVRKMEFILLSKLRDESINAQKQAMAQVKAGETAQAVETLKDFLSQLEHTQLEPELLTPLRKQVENRMQQYRTIQAQENLAKASTKMNESSNWDEGKYQKKILKTQEQVVQLMDQYRALMKEGKYKDASLAALKAGELDPDNLAVRAAIRIAQTEKALKDHEKEKTETEEMFLEALRNGEGPYVDSKAPMAFDAERAKLAAKRTSLDKGISSFNPNAIERDIERKLTRPISVNFQKTPLSNVIRDLQALSGVNIVLDNAALNAANVGLDQPLSLSVEHISMKCVLNLLLKQVDLTYVIKNEVLNITTESSAKGGFTQVVYPVADLVTPVPDHPASDVWSFEKLMERQIANNGVNMMGGNTPMQGPFGLQGGQPVSSSSGLGGSTNLNSPGSPNEFARTSKGLENQLINLITNTIAPETWESAGGPGKIQFFPLGMQLVIAQQTQDVQEQVQELLAALRRLQDLEVAIEMRLVSVSEAFFEKIGVNFSMNIPTHNSQSLQNQLLSGQFQPPGIINTPFPPSLRGLVSGLTVAQTFTPDLGVPISSGSYAFSNPPFGGYPATAPGGGGIALGLAFLNDIQVAMFLEAAQGDRRTNIMQAPKITVFNGQTASINVNTTQFFLLGVTLATSPFGQLIMSPQQVPFPLGVFLTVNPVVSADRRFVRMNFPALTMTNLVDATVPLIPLQIPVPSTFFGPGTGTTSGQQENIFTLFFQQPAVSTITVSTTVNVPDGGTVLLGGLKTLSEGRNEFGPPILSKIPYISRLFKNVAYGREANSLMIMVSPRIIINEEEEMIFRGQLEPIPRP